MIDGDDSEQSAGGRTRIDMWVLSILRPRKCPERTTSRRLHISLRVNSYFSVSLYLKTRLKINVFLLRGFGVLGFWGDWSKKFSFCNFKIVDLLNADSQAYKGYHVIILLGICI